MLKQLKAPTVFWDDNSSFTDYSVSALDFSRDTISLASLNQNDDYLYFGLYKQFNGVYVEVSVPNDASTTFDIEYYNGTTWTDISNDIDETLGFSRSGFIRWDQNQTDWATVAVNSITKFWIRLRPAATFDADMALTGMNIVYSDDRDLLTEDPDVLNYISSNETTYILRHLSARDDIIQSIRNDGRFKTNFSDAFVRQFDAWDLLDIDEVRRWSTFLALEKIYANLIAAPDDVWTQKSQYFAQKAKEAGEVYWITLDFDDDGATDIEERLATNFRNVRLFRT